VRRRRGTSSSMPSMFCCRDGLRGGAGDTLQLARAPDAVRIGGRRGTASRWRLLRALTASFARRLPRGLVAGSTSEPSDSRGQVVAVGDLTRWARGLGSGGECRARGVRAHEGTSRALGLPGRRATRGVRARPAASRPRPSGAGDSHGFLPSRRSMPVHRQREGRTRGLTGYNESDKDLKGRECRQCSS
jgi:hypothetical protein